VSTTATATSAKRRRDDDEVVETGKTKEPADEPAGARRSYLCDTTTSEEEQASSRTADQKMSTCSKPRPLLASSSPTSALTQVLAVLLLLLLLLAKKEVHNNKVVHGLFLTTSIQTRLQLQGRRQPHRRGCLRIQPPGTPSFSSSSIVVSSGKFVSSIAATPEITAGEEKTTTELSHGVPASINKGLLLMTATSLFILTITMTNRPAAAAAAANTIAAAAGSASSDSAIVRLGWRNLASAAALLATTVGIGLWTIWQQHRLARSLGVAAVRCAVQLNLIGGLVLAQYLGLAGTRPWMVLAWVATAGVLAGHEAAGRCDDRHSYPLLRRHLAISILVGCASVMGMAATFRMLGPIRPWFAPRIWIPISGMLFGNALTASGLAASTWADAVFSTRRDAIDFRLLRGATWDEALQSTTQSTFATALAPTINSLSVTGIVHLPGMLTGQILAGQSPYQAAAYQVMIFFLIASASLLSVQSVIFLASAATVDKANHRLVSSEKLNPPAATSTKKNPIFFSLMGLVRRRKCEKRVFRSKNTKHREVSLPKKSVELSPPNDTGSPVLCLNKVKVARTGAIVSLELRPGDRIGLQGPSGAGKSQILRTIVGLEETDPERLLLLGQPLSSQSLPDWRRRVVLVPQKYPSLEGSPRQVFDEVSRYPSQQRNKKIDKHFDVSGAGRGGKDPVEIAEKWKLPPSAFDRSWSTLSGGEAQRASLAIALALELEVLLLDESTSALDEPTALRVEETIRQMGVPVMIVSHSSAQLNRFCTDSIVVKAPRVAKGAFTGT